MPSIVMLSRVYFRILLKGGQMLSTKIKGGSGFSTNYVIRCTKNPKGGQTESRGGGGGQKHPLPPPEINPAQNITGTWKHYIDV